MPEKRRGHEPHGFRTSKVVLLLSACVGSIFIAFGVVRGMFWIGDAPFGKKPAVHEQVFPPPRLQTTPASDLATLKAIWNRRLHGYGWVDRSRGVVRIPIDRAMGIVAARGDKAYEPLPTANWDARPKDGRKDDSR